MLLEHAADRPANAACSCCVRAGTSWSARSRGASCGRCRARRVGDERLLRPAARRGPRRRRDGWRFVILHALYWLAVRWPRRPLRSSSTTRTGPTSRRCASSSYLLGRLADQPIAVLIGARRRSPARGACSSGSPGTPRPRVRELGALGAAAVAELVRGRPGAGDDFCARCLELTSGNPLQVRELLVAIDRRGTASDAALAAAAEVAARSLGRSVLRRLGALSAGAQALARAVAVFEDDARCARVRARRAGPAALRPPTSRAGGRAARRRPARVHPSARARGRLRRLSFGERARTHRRAARLLARPAPPRAGERAPARIAARRRRGRRGLLRAAARRAPARAPPPRPSTTSSVRCASRRGRRRPAVLAELGRAEARGRPEAVEHLEAAIELAPDPRGRAALLLEFGRALHHAGRIEEASDAFLRGLEELGAEDAASWPSTWKART